MSVLDAMVSNLLSDDNNSKSRNDDDDESLMGRSSVLERWLSRWYPWRNPKKDLERLELVLVLGLLQGLLDSCLDSLFVCSIS